MKTLDDSRMQELAKIGAETRQQLSEGKVDLAQLNLEHAWNLVPEPKAEFDISISLVLGAIRLLASSKQPSYALRWINELQKLPVSAIDAEPNFLMGMTYIELNDESKAFEHFDKAYKMSKGRCFQGEEKKYLDFYKKRASGK